MDRTRRLRKSPSLRRLVRENQLTIDDLIYPLFIEEGKGIKYEIPSMPGIFRYSLDMLWKELNEIVELDISAILLFGISSKKDDVGSESWNEEGLVQRVVRAIKIHYPHLLVITDICFCEYTDHGHCGVIDSGQLNNDATLVNIQKQVISHAASGADMVAPSGMIDGSVRAIREILDRHHFVDLPIMSYAVKYQSSFYGPFRDAMHSMPVLGDRKSYQMDISNRFEALKKAAFDDAEGADILMVKPALSYLDIVRDLKNNFDKPIAVYNVSGEYAMIKAASQKGWIDEKSVVMESLTSMKRAGADIIITYFAKYIAKLLSRNYPHDGGEK